MADYAGLAATASRLIREDGRTMTLRSLAKSGDAWAPTLTPSDQSVIGVVSRYNAREIGDLVQSDDKKILLSADVIPAKDDRIIDGAVDYAIINVQEIKPGPTAVLYILQVRQ